MKIKTINISAFGGLKNLELNLDNNFNIVYGDNENGKTTIMSFIKMMFYGTERGSAQLSKNPRKKYLPWDGSTMAGSIDFSDNGRDYRIERIFGSSNSSDKVTLTDLVFGTRESVSADIGTKLFGLSSAAFERSIFIGQLGFPESNNIAVGELNGKLSNITLTGDEAVSYDKIFERLSNAKYSLMSKSGKSGIYDKNIKHKKELEEELSQSVNAYEKIENTKASAETLTKEINALQQKADSLKAQIESENDVRNAEKLRDLLSLKAELDKLNQDLTLENGTVADEMFVRKIEFCLSKTEAIKTKLEAKVNEISILENNLKLALNPIDNATPEKAKELTEKTESIEKENSEITAKIAELEKITPKKQNIFSILAVIAASLGCGLYFIKPIITIIALAIAVILIIITVAKSSKQKSEANKRQSEILDLKLKLNQNISLIATIQSNLTAINAALNNNATVIENQKQLLSKANEELSALEKEKEQEYNTLLSLISPLKQAAVIEDIPHMLDELKLTAAKQKEIKQNINYILKYIGNISYSEAQEKLNNLKSDIDIDFAAVKSEYENLIKTIGESKTQVATILTEAKAIISRTKPIESIKTEIKALDKKIASQKEYCDCLDTVTETLTEAYAELRQSYGSELEIRAGKIFNSLTGGKYTDMSISKSFDITVNKADIFGSKELDYLSSGTADQAYLSLRLALTELISADNALPIILDDALTQYDDTRTKTVVEFLKEYSLKGQIIMFTCHNSVASIGDGAKANIIRL